MGYTRQAQPMCHDCIIHLYKSCAICALRNAQLHGSGRSAKMLPSAAQLCVYALTGCSGICQHTRWAGRLRFTASRHAAHASVTGCTSAALQTARVQGPRPARTHLEHAAAVAQGHGQSAEWASQCLGQLEHRCRLGGLCREHLERLAGPIARLLLPLSPTNGTTLLQLLMRADRTRFIEMQRLFCCLSGLLGVESGSAK